MARFTFLMEYYDYIENIENHDINKDFDIYIKNENEILLEGLIKTHPTQNSIDILQKRFKELRVEIGRDENEIYIEGNFDELKNYLPIINNLGYFISILTLNGNDWIKKYDDKTKPVAIYLEPKFDIKIFPLPNILYHTSPKKYDKKILKIGLIPKSKNQLSNHPDRIYLSDNLNMSKIFGNYIINQNIDNDYSIFKIDTTNLKINLYRDINAIPFGFYTENNIASKFISQIK